MTDPDKKTLNEEDLEMLQRARLLELFSRVETYDRRQSVIGFCETLVKAQKAD